MQTILGANGQIGTELAKALKLNYTSDIRLVSRNPKKVNDTDTLFFANLLDKEMTYRAVEGSEIAYFTLGLPMNSEMWESRFPTIMQNVIDACKEYRTKLVFFDNTYMYPQNRNALTEETTFAPVGRKGKVRRQIVEMLLKAMESKEIEAVICRAPEFYGPGQTKSITNTFIFDAIKADKKLKVLMRDDVLRTLIWTPDASSAMALIGNSADAYGQTWHLPCDDNRLTYKQFIALTSKVYGKKFTYRVIPSWLLSIGALFVKRIKELQELLPRYGEDNIFDSSKFKKRFPQFRVTTYQEGIEKIKEEQENK